MCVCVCVGGGGGGGGGAGYECTLLSVKQSDHSWLVVAGGRRREMAEW